MIVAVRLLEYNRKRRHLMRSYTTASGVKWQAGFGNVPSAWRLVDNPAEVAELQEMPQFEVRSFKSLEALRAVVQVEMEQRAREGAAPVRAAIEAADVTAVPISKVEPRRELTKVLSSGGLRPGAGAARATGARPAVAVGAPEHRVAPVAPVAPVDPVALVDPIVPAAPGTKAKRSKRRSTGRQPR